MSVTINGKNYGNVNGTVSINNNKITVGGVDIEDLQQLDCKEINIIIHGNVDVLEVENGELTINGSVKSLDSRNGNVQCWNVDGNVETRNGNVQCGAVQGSVKTRNGSISERK